MSGAGDDLVTPKPAWVLGLLNVSLLPWFAVAVWVLEDAATWIRLSIAYSALTLGVFGGIRMGFAFAARGGTPTTHDYGIAILLPLLGWIALIPGPLAGCALLAAGIAVSAWSDHAAARADR